MPPVSDAGKQAAPGGFEYALRQYPQNAMVMPENQYLRFAFTGNGSSTHNLGTTAGYFGLPCRYAGRSSHI